MADLEHLIDEIEKKEWGWIWGWGCNVLVLITQYLI